MSKVIVGMSGGVDSSVCAYLLKEKGYEVIGVTYDFRHDIDEPEEIYRTFSDAFDAKAVCDVLGIEHYAVNYTRQFKERVEKKFTEEYLSGRTPNPCIICNPSVKWTAMLETASQTGAANVATGHYARIIKNENGRFSVKNSTTADKDQTYVLYGLRQDQLKPTIFPIGDHSKDEIRDIADRVGLPVAHKKDSQDICYIEDGDYAGYIRRETGEEGSAGNFVLSDGTILGPHKGTINYTIGQRKGLGISYKKPLYVNRIDTISGDVTLGDNEELFTDRLEADDLKYMGEERFDENRLYMAKIRYSHNAVPCYVNYIDESSITVTFEGKVRAVTPGQALVLYRDDWIAGGGTIR